MSENETKQANVSGILDDEDQNEDAQKDRYLTFRLGDEDYGIPIAHVTEIIGVQKITNVPDMPDFVKGVINLRGRVIPVVDVRTRFQMQAQEYTDRTCVIVVNIQGMAVGLVVDTVKEVISIPEAQISEPPKMNRAGGRYLHGLGRVGDEVKILLDIDRLLHDEEIDQLRQG